ncbi:GNAT family N-acetyltransferase [Microbispora bryophytorum]|uniref:GNAT family N-acetyltransferase n=1 Tax=Microbispora bryophytorum subsp. camponoti TaxID=1677852 RepID=A0ABR8L3U7_9ACTN|nr:GNAT family N-acetyltransferase [Microbispora camponoti]MBD3144409.1 GNAT family N-acetyltransferase [Microbispora camponoti]
MQIKRVAPVENDAEPGEDDPDGPAGRSPLAGLYGIARACDHPGPAMSWRHFTASVLSGSGGERGEAWVACDGGRTRGGQGERSQIIDSQVIGNQVAAADQVAGGHILHFPQDDNTHLALLRLMTHPDRRREGIGGALLDHAIGRARDEGRRVLIAEAAADGPGTAFAKARGFSPASTETRLVLDLRTADWSGLELLRARAVRHATCYSLERWAGPTPDDLLGDMAGLTEGMNDEPLGDLAMEDQRWSAGRVRAREEMLARAGQRTYTMIARHTASGEPAGFTQLVVDAERPEGWARQSSTTVLAPHRGRRLGLVLKLANITWFRACEPSAERVITWISVANPHMRAINEAMGFEVFDTWHQWQLDI